LARSCAYPLFRDREELPTSASLRTEIVQALRDSRYLIVVCSPHAAASHWVNEEIRAFRAMGRGDRILAVIVDGEPNASDKPESGVPEAFPESLRYGVNADHGPTNEPRDPLAADIRPGKDTRVNARLKIVAGLLGLGFDELRQRDIERQRRRRLMMSAAAVTIVGALSGTSDAARCRRVQRCRQFALECGKSRSRGAASSTRLRRVGCS